MTAIGCDVSAFQPHVDWPGVAGSGRVFAFCKATQGVTYTSHVYTAQAAGAKAAGLLVGAYHFYSTQSTPADQMAHFFAVARGVDLDFPLAIDVEEQAHDPLGGVSAGEYADGVRACLDAMVSEGNRRPLMYCSPGFLARLPDRDFASVADLWVADYNPHLLLPHGFTTWRIWQTSGNRKIAGTEMDDDVYNGSENDLRAWLGAPLAP